MAYERFKQENCAIAPDCFDPVFPRSVAVEPGLFMAE